MTVIRSTGLHSTISLSDLITACLHVTHAAVPTFAGHKAKNASNTEVEKSTELLAKRASLHGKICFVRANEKSEK